MQQKDGNVYFLHLVAQHEMLGMILLGKVPDPSTGKAHRGLEQVREVISFLEMIEVKTRGNLTADEERELRRVLTLLRLNYVEEIKRPEPAPEAAPKKAAGAEAKSAERQETATESGEEKGKGKGAAAGDGAHENGDEQSA